MVGGVVPSAGRHVSGANDKRACPSPGAFLAINRTIAAAAAADSAMFKAGRDKVRFNLAVLELREPVPWMAVPNRT